MTATPAKLKDGSWGARVVGAPNPGDVVVVTTKAGKTWQARVERVVWQGDGVALCVTTGAAGQAHGGRTSSRRCGCSDSENCCRPCRCEAYCNCRGGNVYDC